LGKRNTRNFKNWGGPTKGTVEKQRKKITREVGQGKVNEDESS